MKRFVLQRTSNAIAHWEDVYRSADRTSLDAIREKWILQHGNAPDLLRVVEVDDDDDDLKPPVDCATQAGDDTAEPPYHADLCPHGRGPSACPHCMGINQTPLTLPCKAPCPGTFSFQVANVPRGEDRHLTTACETCGCPHIVYWDSVDEDETLEYIDL